MVLGDLLFKNNSYEEAITAFRKAQQLAPGTLNTYDMIARALIKLNRPGEAEQEFKSIIRQLPDHVPAHMSLAVLFEQKGDVKGAKKIYRKILEINPNHPLAANNLAMHITEEENGDLGEALRLAMIAHEQMSENPNINDTLGRVYFKRKSYSLAESHFKNATEAQPDNKIFQEHLEQARKAKESGKKSKDFDKFLDNSDMDESSLEEQMGESIGQDWK